MCNRSEKKDDKKTINDFKLKKFYKSNASDLRPGRISRFKIIKKM
jgi:hypothetical protein